MLAERALWHRERIASALIVSLILLGCGGKAADPIPQYQPGDEARSCSGLKAEIANNEAEIAKLLPSEDATGKNVALGVAGVFLIVPWFFMDFKEGEATEIKALSSPLKKALLTGFHSTAKHNATKAVSPSSETMRTI